MELMQGAKNKTQLAQTRRFLKDFNVRVIPLSAEIGNRAMSLVDGCGGLSVHVRICYNINVLKH